MGYKVTPDEIRGTAGQLDNAKGQVDSLLSQVRNQVNNLGTSWQGAASGNFASLMAKWNSDVNNLNTTLSEIATAMRTAASNYEATESANARGFNVG